MGAKKICGILRMVVLEPNICGTTKEYELCSQTMKDLYNLKYELGFAIDKQTYIQKLIDKLQSWIDAPLSSAKWRNITRLMELSKELRESYDNILKNVKITGKISFRDANNLLSRPEIKNSIMKSFRKDVSPATIAAAIAYDTPNIFNKETGKFIKEQQTLWSRINPFKPPAESPQMAAAVTPSGPGSLRNLGNFGFGAPTAAEKEAKAAEAAAARAAARAAAVAEDVRRVEESIRRYVARRGLVYEDDLVRQYSQKLLENKGIPKDSREEYVRGRVREILGGDPLVMEYKEDGIVQWGLKELPEKEKMRSTVFENMNRNSVEKKLVEVTLDSFKEKSNVIKNLNRDYNKTLEGLNEMYTTTKQVMEGELGMLNNQRETYKYAQEKNIDQISKMTADDLSLWKRVFHPETVEKLIKYSNILVEYLTLLNQVLFEDPAGDDPEILAMFFNNEDEFSAGNYYTKSREKIRRYIEKLREYQKEWKTYQTTINSILPFLNSKNDDDILIGMNAIKIGLEPLRPALSVGIKKVATSVTKDVKEKKQLVDEINRAIEDLETKPKTLDNIKKKDMLKNLVRDIQKQFTGISRYGRSINKHKNRPKRLRNARSKKKVARMRRVRSKKAKDSHRGLRYPN